MGAIANTKTILTAAVANGATVTLPYPAGTAAKDFTDQGLGSVAVGPDSYKQGSGAGTVAITYGASNITVTNNSGITWPVGADFYASFGRIDINGSYNLTYPLRTQVQAQAAADAAA